MNWWLFSLILGSLMGALGIFVTYDQLPSTHGQDVTPTESATKLLHSHSE
jgi:hypothetical protein